MIKKLFMAPTRKSRSVNKRFPDDADPDKDVGNSRQRKRKLSDMLGFQWSKEELEHFYEAYRKYGKDWKKVACGLRNRTVEMVEALYNMNRAYLSLPEGTASVVGLIAMMTDHYNVLEESDSDQERNDASRLSRKPQNRGQGKVRLSALKEGLLQSQSVASSDGCLSLLKRRRSDGCAVRRRTPRFPVSYSLRKDDGENYISLNKRGRKSEVDDNVAHVAALALTEASQRGGSPKISQSRYRINHMKSSPLKSRERMNLQSEMVQAKLCGTVMDQDCLEGSLGSRGAETGDCARDASALMNNEGFGMLEVSQKRTKVDGKKEKVEVIRISQLDDGWEACSGTEGGLYVGDVKGKADIEVTNAKIEQSSSQATSSRNKQLFFGDGSSALDALQTLADLSLMMPAPRVESESSVQFKQEKPTVDLANRSSVLQAVSTSHRRDKTKLLGARKKELCAFSGVETSKSGKFKHERESTIDLNALSEGDLHPLSTNKLWRRKRKFSSFKAFVEEDKKLVNKVKCAGQTFAPSKQWKSVIPAECSSNNDQTRTRTDSVVSTAQVPTTSEVNLPSKRKSKRKMDPRRIPMEKEIKFSEITLKDAPNKYSTLQDMDMLSYCLSSYMVRRWCTFEWFYSAIDYPWFAKREFDEYLNHVGLGHIPRLTRVELGVIRSSLGKPRRFSENFLREEREKLKQYRESVRKHYTELRAGIREGLPTDLARPLSVGQHVIALHPKSREVHDGSVLTVDHDKCRIQFDRPELGVAFVMDIDCMPLNPLDNMPEALRRENIAIDKFSVKSRKQRAGQSDFGGSMVFTPSEHLDNVDSPINALINQATEAILMELKHANDDLLQNQNDGESSLNNSESFKKQYAMVSSALLNLRQRNTYPGNSLPPWLKAPTISSGLGGPIISVDNSSINYQVIGSSVSEIVNDSRLKAQTMVDAAIQVMSSMKEGEDAFARLGEALDSLGKRKCPPESGSSIIRCPKQVNGVMAYQHHLASTSEPLLIGHASGSKLHHDTDRNEVQIPSELITSCVATLLMIQTCTERQCPPADVAQMLDSAVTSLHPCCPQNLPIYREIQMSMGRIKTQMLALVPS